MTSSSICNLAPGSLKIEVFDGLDSILWLPLIGGCCSCCSCSLKIKILHCLDPVVVLLSPSLPGCLKVEILYRLDAIVVSRLTGTLKIEILHCLDPVVIGLLGRPSSGVEVKILDSLDAILRLCTLKIEILNVLHGQLFSRRLRRKRKIRWHDWLTHRCDRVHRWNTRHGGHAGERRFPRRSQIRRRSLDSWNPPRSVDDFAWLHVAATAQAVEVLTRFRQWRWCRRWGQISVPRCLFLSGLFSCRLID
mmetsp:Transcript_62540/g.103098  ORF Transcript_62540/g.103098 Transcript_62540/m.103098 type:complete len:249 (+) Transcript_62540:2517-3263(+)